MLETLLDLSIFLATTLAGAGFSSGVAEAIVEGLGESWLVAAVVALWLSPECVTALAGAGLSSGFAEAVVEGLGEPWLVAAVAELWLSPECVNHQRQRQLETVSSDP